jgi:hypothetical protein
MSIVSLVIAPTLATIYSGDASAKLKKEAATEVVITKADNNKELVSAATGKLVAALTADNVIQKDNYTLAVKNGKITVDGAELNSEVAAKYNVLMADLAGADIKLANSQK